MSLLVRTWNVFHGRSHPPGKRLFLEGMVRLVTDDRPAVLLLQEVPPWALDRIGKWSGMTVVAALARRPSIGPLPSTAEVGKRITAIDSPRLLGAFTGQANAILLDPTLRVLDEDSIVLNARPFRRTQAEWLRLPLVDELYWAKERRVCHAVRLRLADGRTATVANLHVTGSRDKRIPDAEILRAATFADAIAGPDEICILGGDFNARRERSVTLAELAGPVWGFTEAGEGIDHLLVRGAESSPPRRWPIARRKLDGAVVSDHAPVEVTLT